MFTFISGMFVGAFFAFVIASILSVGAYRKGYEDAITEMEIEEEKY